MRLRICGVALIAAMSAGSASAHSPYLLPNTFDATGRDHITVQGAFTEQFFAPEVAMKADDYHAIGPNGAKTAVSPTYLRDVALFELATPADGTYRITTGTRAGRVAKAHLVKDEWIFLNPEEPVPAGVHAVDMQSVTRAEVYVSRGAPSDTVLAPIGKGIEFRAITHPNKLFVGQAATFQVLLNGKPLPRQPIGLHHGDEVYSGGEKGTRIVADADGRFSLKLAAPGVYQAMTRHRIDAEPGAPAQSLTYALTFDVTQ